jgi:hypothetical protein
MSSLIVSRILFAYMRWPRMQITTPSLLQRPQGRFHNGVTAGAYRPRQTWRLGSRRRCGRRIAGYR